MKRTITRRKALGKLAAIGMATRVGRAKADTKTEKKQRRLPHEAPLEKKAPHNRPLIRISAVPTQWRSQVAHLRKRVQANNVFSEQISTNLLLGEMFAASIWNVATERKQFITQTLERRPFDTVLKAQVAEYEKASPIQQLRWWPKLVNQMEQRGAIELDPTERDRLVFTPELKQLKLLPNTVGLLQEKKILNPKRTFDPHQFEDYVAIRSGFFRHLFDSQEFQGSHKGFAIIPRGEKIDFMIAAAAHPGWQEIAQTKGLTPPLKAYVNLVNECARWVAEPRAEK